MSTREEITWVCIDKGNAAETNTDAATVAKRIAKHLSLSPEEATARVAAAEEQLYPFETVFARYEPRAVRT